MNSDLTFFLLGALVSIPAGMFATYLYKVSEKRLAHRNASHAKRRLSVLREEISEVQIYVEGPHRFTQLMLARLVAINVIWIGSSILAAIPTEKHEAPASVIGS